MGYSKTMPARTARQRKKRRSQSRRQRTGTLRRLVHRSFRGGLWASRLIFQTVRASPRGVQIVLIPILVLLVGLGINWAYHTFHKPTEVFFPFDHTLAKQPKETWQQYQSLFHEHATKTITPEFLAALAQAESDGNPVARTYWRWQWSWNPLDWYRPSSSAVGMFQMTDGTFLEASRLCIHNHKVIEDGPWHDWESCWFTSFYTRVLPSHAIELTAAWLDRGVEQILLSRKGINPTMKQKHNLAAVIHLCGIRIGRAYVARNFHTTPHQRCGDHTVQPYLTRINNLKYGFLKPWAKPQTINKAP